MRLMAAAFALLLAGSSLPSHGCAQVQESSAEHKSAFTPPSHDTLDRASFSLSTPQAPAWYAMFTNIPGDWVRTGATTFRWESVPAIIAVASTTSLLLLADHSMYRSSHTLYRQSEAIRSASNLFIYAGDGRTSLGIAAAFATYGFVDGDQRALRTSSQTVEALLASGITVQLLKRIAGRESPQAVTHDRAVWRPFPSINQYNHHQSKYYAFPSGHITTAMATVTVIAENYPEVQWVRPVGYTLTGITAIALVNKGWHWYSDFPLAIAMGYTFGHIAAHRDDANLSNEDPSSTYGFEVLPSIGAAGPGVTLALAF